MHLWLHNLISLRFDFLFSFCFIAIFSISVNAGGVGSVYWHGNYHSHILRVGIVIIVVSVESLFMRLVRFRLPRRVCLTVD